VKYISAVFVFIAGATAHWLWSTHFPIAGLAPQVLLVLTVAVSTRAGAVAGQCYGFAWGLFLDILSAHVFGAHALGLTVIAYFTGGIRRQMDVGSAAPQLVLVALLTPIYFLYYGTAGWIFEHEFLWSGWLAFVVIPFYNCIVAPFAFEFTRRFVDL
jgi:rod shape-determining protein MreD